MDIEECKETYEMLKKGKQFVANVDKDFFLKFAETVLSELEKKDKEILRYNELKQENEQLKSKLWYTGNHIPRID